MELQCRAVRRERPPRRFRFAFRKITINGRFNLGHGWVKQHDGDYADAISKKHGAILLGSESTGALFTPLVFLLRLLHKASNAPGSQDSTIYGAGHASPRQFYGHHTAAISASIVCADAQVIQNTAAHLSFSLTMRVVGG